MKSLPIEPLKHSFGTLKCKRCTFEWEPRVKNPVSCPSCKVRIDYGKWSIGGRK